MLIRMFVGSAKIVDVIDTVSLAAEAKNIILQVELLENIHLIRDDAKKLFLII